MTRWSEFSKASRAAVEREGLAGARSADDDIEWPAGLTQLLGHSLSRGLRGVIRPPLRPLGRWLGKASR